MVENAPLPSDTPDCLRSNLSLEQISESPLFAVDLMESLRYRARHTPITEVISAIYRRSSVTVTWFNGGLPGRSGVKLAFPYIVYDWS